MASSPKNVTIVGAGILGLWQALVCARAGFRVRVFEKNVSEVSGNVSALSGGMLAPDCEAESAPRLVRDLGRAGIMIWRDVYRQTIERGSLVVAGARDQAELSRFGKMTSGFERVDRDRVDVLEPDLAGRFTNGLLFGFEAHVVVPDALAFLRSEVTRLGGEIRSGEMFDVSKDWRGLDDHAIIDCRGFAARDEGLPGTREVLANLRGVRGERVIVKTGDVHLNRPVRVLHPRHPIYVVPWGQGRFVVGATVLESVDESGASVRSVLELLGTLFSLHPAFSEAEILDVGAGVRPAFPDNLPRVVVGSDQRFIAVNGAYRHGFLLAPVLAECVCSYLLDGNSDHPLMAEQNSFSSFASAREGVGPDL